MIIKEVKITGEETLIKFSGDPRVQWFIRDLYETNRTTPYITSIVNGMAALKCDPRSIGDTMKLGFYTEGEAGLAKEIDDAVVQPTTTIDVKEKVVVVSMKTRDWIFETIKRSPRFIGIFIAITIGFFILDDTGKYRQMYKNFSAAGAADALDSFTETSDERLMILNNNHPIYESAQLKKIEDALDNPATEEKDFKFKNLFQYDGEGIFIMKDVLKNGEEVALLEHGEAEDRCESIGTYLPTYEAIKMGTRTIRVKDRGAIPEWTIESYGMMSDDYVVYMKDAEMFNGAYVENGRVFADADDVKLAARCMFRAKDFEE